MYKRIVSTSYSSYLELGMLPSGGSNCSDCRIENQSCMVFFNGKDDVARGCWWTSKLEEPVVACG